jgi:hypothetical protein
MAPRGRQPKYSTEEERSAAKQAQNAKRQREFKARQKQKEKQDRHISTATSEEEASRAGQATTPNLDEDEPTSPATNDLTTGRAANNENPRESGTNLLYWATVLEDPTSRPPEKPVVRSVENWRTFAPFNVT